jgi:hypothetical protein
VFGMFDALVLNSLRLPVVTGTAGMEWLDLDWFKDLRRRIIFLPDKGEAHVARRFANRLDWRGRVHLLDYPEGCKDPADYAKIGKRDQLLKELSRYMEGANVSSSDTDERMDGRDQQSPDGVDRAGGRGA